MNVQQFLENQIAQTRLELQIKERLLSEFLALNPKDVAEGTKPVAPEKPTIQEVNGIEDVLKYFGDTAFTLQELGERYRDKFPDMYAGPERASSLVAFCRYWVKKAVKTGRIEVVVEPVRGHRAGVYRNVPRVQA